MAEQKFVSDLAKRQEAKPKKHYFFDVEGIFGLGGKPIARIAITRGVGRDGESAILEAHKYAHDEVKKNPGAENALNDFDFMGDAKIRSILFRLCRAVDPTDPEKALTTKDGQHTYPAFPSPDWMTRELHTDQLASLMALVSEVRQKEAPRPEGLDENEALGLTDESMERLVKLLTDQLGTEIPERVLRDAPRPYLTHFCVMVAYKLSESRTARDVLLDEREAWEREKAEFELKIAGLESALEGKMNADLE